jgi:hypothetical protein
MRTAVKHSTTPVRCIALVLAVIPATCYAANLNVWIYQPVNDRTNGVRWTTVIGVFNFDLFFARQQITNVGVLWSWQNANIDTGSTDVSGSAATEPTLFEDYGEWIVTATYDGATSHGVEVTVVCPDLTITAGLPDCCVPMWCQGDPYGTNYVYGGTFTYTLTYVDQTGTTLPANDLWTYEEEPTYPFNTCPFLPGGDDPGWTNKPFQIQGNSFTDFITNLYNEVPPPCYTESYNLSYFGATEEGPWTCPVVVGASITVEANLTSLWVTTVAGTISDQPCSY